MWTKYISLTQKMKYKEAYICEARGSRKIFDSYNLNVNAVTNLRRMTDLTRATTGTVVIYAHKKTHRANLIQDKYLRENSSMICHSFLATARNVAN